MTTLTQDTEALERSLADSRDAVTVTLSRDTAQFVATILKARTQGREVIVTHGHGEVTPAEAAALLGMSRPQVRRLMDRGALPFRKVGTHHRITVADITSFQEAERARRAQAMKEYSDLENELGLT